MSERREAYSDPSAHKTYGLGVDGVRCTCGAEWPCPVRALLVGDEGRREGRRASDVAELAKVLTHGDPLAYDNIHTDWARESIARTIIRSRWFTERLSRAE